MGGHLRPRVWGVKEGGDGGRGGALFPRPRAATCCAIRCQEAAHERAFHRHRPALQLYICILIAAAVLSWLIAFNVVNVRNQFVAMVADFLYRITEPALRPIRNVLPNLGGIDISPMILILIIFFIHYVILALHHSQRALSGRWPRGRGRLAAGRRRR